MKYEQARKQIRDGDLCFVRGRGLAPYLVRLWTRSRFAHVGVCVWVTAGGTRRLLLLEAVPGAGIRPVLLSDYVTAHGPGQVYWHALLSATYQLDRGRAVSYALDRLGCPYPGLGQFLLSFSNLARLARRLGAPAVDLSRGHKLFCSEYALGVLLAAGYVPDGADAGLAPLLADPGTVALLPCLRNRGDLE